MRLEIEDWTIEETMGYKPISTFYADFSIADKFGVNAIKDTYNRIFKDWKDNYKYLTELTMVLNWKLWIWNNHNTAYTKVYNDLWEKTDLYAQDNLKDDELTYFYNTTD